MSTVVGGEKVSLPNVSAESDNATRPRWTPADLCMTRKLRYQPKKPQPNTSSKPSDVCPPKHPGKRFGRNAPRRCTAGRGAPGGDGAWNQGPPETFCLDEGGRTRVVLLHVLFRDKALDTEGRTHACLTSREEPRRSRNSIFLAREYIVPSTWGLLTSLVRYFPNRAR